MKKIFLSAILFFAALSAFAQGDFTYGAKAGAALNWIPQTTILPDDEVLPNFGFYGGVTGAYSISHRSAIQAELLYSRKGISTRGAIFGNEYTRYIHYLQLPILYSQDVIEDTFKLMIGPEVGYALTSVVRNAIKQKDPASAQGLNRFNIALAIQGTYMINDNFGVDLKLDYGLTQTFTDATDKGRNLSLMLGICYLLDN